MTRCPGTGRCSAGCLGFRIDGAGTTVGSNWPSIVIRSCWAHTRFKLNRVTQGRWSELWLGSTAVVQ